MNVGPAQALRHEAAYSETWWFVQSALAGGSTASRATTAGPYTVQREPLLRHVDLAPFGRQSAAGLIDPLDPKKEWAR